MDSLQVSFNLLDVTLSKDNDWIESCSTWSSCGKGWGSSKSDSISESCGLSSLSSSSLSQKCNNSFTRIGWNFGRELVWFWKSMLFNISLSFVDKSDILKKI